MLCAEDLQRARVSVQQLVAPCEQAKATQAAEYFALCLCRIG